jgi:hypothetical protein
MARPRKQDGWLVWPVSAWPAQDQALWAAGTAPATGLRRGRRHAETLRPKSIEHAWKGYGRFLSVLAAHGRLSPAEGPAERLTFETAALFFDALRDAGNIDNTIKARLFHLRMALRIMVPSINFDWLTRPNDCALDTLLPFVPNPDKFTPDAKLLFEWGLDLMKMPLASDCTPGTHQHLMFCRDYRNGLIIALLAARAPRLKSLAQMRLETNLYRLNGEYWVRLQSQLIKNKRELDYSLPPTLTPFITRYLDEIRPALLDPHQADAVWGNGDGGAFTGEAIGTMIRRQAKRKFSHDFGPHRFRDAFASMLAAADPRNPGLAAVVLGITEGVVNTHYRQARQADAARKLQAHLSEERERTRILAMQAFGHRLTK